MAALSLALAAPASSSPPGSSSPPIERQRLASELDAAETPRRASAARQLATLEPEVARPLLKRALQDPELPVRMAATLAAGQLGLPDVTQTLLDEATHGEWKLREAALTALGKLRGPPRRDVELALGRALADPEVSVRLAALRALVERPPTLEGKSATTDAIVGALSDESPEQRRVAAESLERLADPFAVHGLVAHVDDTSPEVRLAVARALGTLGDRRAASAVLRLVDDSAEEVRAAAISTLGLLAAETAVPRLEPMLNLPREPLAGPVALALGRIAGEPGDDVVLRALRARAGEALVRAVRNDLNRTAALEGLRVAGGAAASLLSSLLPALGELPNDGALIVAGELMHEGDVTVTRLVLGLARLASDGRFDAQLVRARPPAGAVRDELVAWLAARLGDPGVAARQAAAVALGELGDSRAAAALEAALGDPDRGVQRRALSSLVRTSSAREDTLLRAARDEDPALVRASLAALGQRRDTPSRLALAAALAAADVATAMIAALTLSDDPGAGALVPQLVATMKNGLDRARDPASLALMGPLRGKPDPVAREVCLALAATDDSAAGGAVELLGAMRDKASAERLLRALPKLARRPLRRARLYAALGDMALAGDDPAAAHALLAALSDADAGVRLSAAWALGKVQHAAAWNEADHALDEHLADPVGAVRANALAALGRRQRSLSSDVLSRLAHDADPAVRANAIVLQGSARRPAPRGGPDYLLLHLQRPATTARIGLPDGFVVTFLADDRDVVRDEGVPTGALEILPDEAPLR